MKKTLKAVCMIALCVALSCCIMSCEISFPIETDNTTKADNTTEATEEVTSDKKSSYSFDTVEELIIAIKKNPATYKNRQIEVLGTAIKDDYEGNSYIVDDSDFDFSSVDSSFDVQYYVWLKTQKETNATISVVITDELSYAVVSTGDYVKMRGTVKVSNGEIYLDDCECEIVKCASERK